VTKRFRVPVDRAHSFQYRLSHPISTSRYRELLAIDNVSLAIDPGEFVGIAGPNGCGKSTLLKIVARIFEPDKGKVRISGRVSPFLELGVGFKHDLTAVENIILGGAVLGITRSQAEKQIERVLDFSDLSDFADQRLRNFSSGMVVRLAFAVATMADADVLLLDEVLAVGDEAFQQKCFDVIGEYKRLGKTVVLVTHDLSAIELYCNRAILLKDGHVVKDGKPVEVTELYRRIVSVMADYEHTEDASSDDAQRRWGTREAEMTHVDVVDATGASRRSFLVGEPFEVVVEYRSNTLAGLLVCAANVRRTDGVSLAMPMSRFAGVMPRVSPGEHGRFVYRVPAMNLMTSGYLMNIGLYDRSLRRRFDAIQDAVQFEVTDPTGRYGAVELGGEWRHTRIGSRMPSSSGGQMPAWPGEDQLPG
jgi:ABC-type polysaccharide/polyol phosphate transport system ATPase subunit